MHTLTSGRGVQSASSHRIDESKKKTTKRKSEWGGRRRSHSADDGRSTAGSPLPPPSRACLSPPPQGSTRPPPALPTPPEKRAPECNPPPRPKPSCEPSSPPYTDTQRTTPPHCRQAPRHPHPPPHGQPLGAMRLPPVTTAAAPHPYGRLPDPATAHLHLLGVVAGPPHLLRDPSVPPSPGTRPTLVQIAQPPTGTPLPPVFCWFRVPLPFPLVRFANSGGLLNLFKCPLGNQPTDNPINSTPPLPKKINK